MASPHERTPKGKFVRQRYNAIRRGIAWNLTFDAWWSIWQSSGKWEQRGRSGYVMARKGDEGQYAAGNVIIISTTDNVSSGPHKKNRLPVGVCIDRRKKSNQYIAHRLVNGIYKYLGAYGTPELAHSAYLAGSRITA